MTSKPRRNRFSRSESSCAAQRTLPLNVQRQTCADVEPAAGKVPTRESVTLCNWRGSLPVYTDLKRLLLLLGDQRLSQIRPTFLYRIPPKIGLRTRGGFNCDNNSHTAFFTGNERNSTSGLARLRGNAHLSREEEEDAPIFSPPPCRARTVQLGRAAPQIFRSPLSAPLPSKRPARRAGLPRAAKVK